MALENAKKFLEQVMKDEALRFRLAEKSLKEVVALAGELGFVATEEELLQAEQELRKPLKNSESPVELNLEDMDKIAGGMFWGGEEAPDGHEMGCALAYHHIDYQERNNIWCREEWFCEGNSYEMGWNPEMC